MQRPGLEQPRQRQAFQQQVQVQIAPPEEDEEERPDPGEDRQGEAELAAADFLGPDLPEGVARGVARGDLDPMSKRPFDLSAIYPQGHAARGGGGLRHIGSDRIFEGEKAQQMIGRILQRSANAQARYGLRKHEHGRFPETPARLYARESQMKPALRLLVLAERLIYSDTMAIGI